MQARLVKTRQYYAGSTSDSGGKTVGYSLRPFWYTNPVCSIGSGRYRLPHRPVTYVKCMTLDTCGSMYSTGHGKALSGTAQAMSGTTLGSMVMQIEINNGYPRERKLFTYLITVFTTTCNVLSIFLLKWFWKRPTMLLFYIILTFFES